MDKRIVFTRADGGLSVLGPAPRARRPDESEEAFLARIIAKDVPKDATGVRIISVSEIPADRTFRNAWTDTGVIGHDMGKCREIVRDAIRRARTVKLAALDVEFMRAVEAGDAAKQRDVAARKQALRDAPADPAIDAASTPQELKRFLSA